MSTFLFSSGFEIAPGAFLPAIFHLQDVVDFVLFRYSMYMYIYCLRNEDTIQC